MDSGFSSASNSKKQNRESALNIKPQDVLLLNILGEIFTLLKQFENGLDYFQRASEVNSNHHLTWSNLGKTYEELEQYPKAIESYQKAIELKPTEFKTWNSLGDLFFIQNDLSKAESSFQKAWDFSKNKEEIASLSLGHIHLLRSDQPAALEWYRKSIPLWEDLENFFEGMNSAYTDLKMADHGISRETYDEILQTLREEAEKLIK